MPEESNTPNTPSAPAQTGTVPASNGNTGTEAPKPAATTADTRSFTQEQLDYMFSKERGDAKQAALNALLEESGFDSLDSLKAAAAAKRDQDEAAKSELQKAQDAYTKLQSDTAAETQRLKDELATMQKRQRTSLIDRAIETQARGAIKPDQVIREMRADASIAEKLDAAINDQDVVSVETVKSLVDLFRASNPHFFGKGSPGNFDAHSSGSPTRIDKNALADAMRRDITRSRGGRGSL